LEAACQAALQDQEASREHPRHLEEGHTQAEESLDSPEHEDIQVVHSLAHREALVAGSQVARPMDQWASVEHRQGLHLEDILAALQELEEGRVHTCSVVGGGEASEVAGAGAVAAQCLPAAVALADCRTLNRSHHACAASSDVGDGVFEASVATDDFRLPDLVVCVFVDVAAQTWNGPASKRLKI